jgi:hypothetical protein
MKHPLSERRWLNLWLETVCFTLGHRWVHSPSRKTEWWGGDYDAAPYVLRKRSGNVLFEDVAWWTDKCTRCRYKVRPDHGDRHEVWHRRTRWAIGDAANHGWWCMTRTFKDWRRYPLWVPAVQLLMTPVCAAAQGVIHLWQFNGGGIPVSWFEWILDLQDWWYGVLDRVEYPTP